MKRVLFLVVSAFLAATSSIASMTENVVTKFSENKASEMIKEQLNNGSALVLDMASNVVAKVNAHYSHGSHASHASHASHRSHFSSR